MDNIKNNEELEDLFFKIKSRIVLVKSLDIELFNLANVPPEAKEVLWSVTEVCEEIYKDIDLGISYISCNK